MLTAMFLMWLFGGANPEIFDRDDFRAVGRVVAEEQRAAAVTGLMEQANADLDYVLSVRNGVFARFNEVDDLVESERADYEAIFEPLWSTRRNAHASYLDTVFGMREQMTREEWHQAFALADD